MLVTFYVVWYVITELSRLSWQKDLRDITFFDGSNGRCALNNLTGKQATIHLFPNTAR